MALGLVRAAQGREEEAEALLREAYAMVADTDHRASQLETWNTLARFLRDRGRAEELAQLDPAPRSTAKIA